MYFGDQMAMDDALDAQIEELHQRIRELEATVQRLKLRNEDDAKALAASETANGILEAKVDRLDETLRKFQDLYRKAAKELDELREENFELRRKRLE